MKPIHYWIWLTAALCLPCTGLAFTTNDAVPIAIPGQSHSGIVALAVKTNGLRANYGVIFNGTNWSVITNYPSNLGTNIFSASAFGWLAGLSSGGEGGGATNVFLPTNGFGGWLTGIQAGQAGAQPTNSRLTALAGNNGFALTNVQAKEVQYDHEVFSINFSKRTNEAPWLSDYEPNGKAFRFASYPPDNSVTNLAYITNGFLVIPTNCPSGGQFYYWNKATRRPVRQMRAVARFNTNDMTWGCCDVFNSGIFLIVSRYPVVTGESVNASSYGATNWFLHMEYQAGRFGGQLLTNGLQGPMVDLGSGTLPGDKIPRHNEEVEFGWEVYGDKGDTIRVFMGDQEFTTTSPYLTNLFCPVTGFATNACMEMTMGPFHNYRTDLKQYAFSTHARGTYPSGIAARHNGLANLPPDITGNNINFTNLQTGGWNIWQDAGNAFLTISNAGSAAVDINKIYLSKSGYVTGKISLWANDADSLVMNAQDFTINNSSNTANIAAWHQNQSTFYGNFAIRSNLWVGGGIFTNGTTIHYDRTNIVPTYNASFVQLAYATQIPGTLFVLTNNSGNTGWFQMAAGGGSIDTDDQTASEVLYNNGPSGLASDDVQEAIDELAAYVFDNQAADADLDDLADGSLTGSKVGSGINAANVTTGTISTGVLPSPLQSLNVGNAGALTNLSASFAGHRLLLADHALTNYVFDYSLGAKESILATNAVVFAHGTNFSSGDKSILIVPNANSNVYIYVRSNVAQQALFITTNTGRSTGIVFDANGNYTYLLSSNSYGYMTVDRRPLGKDLFTFTEFSK